MVANQSARRKPATTEADVIKYVWQTLRKSIKAGHVKRAACFSEGLARYYGRRRA